MPAMHVLRHNARHAFRMPWHYTITDINDDIIIDAHYFIHVALLYFLLV